MVCRFVLVKVFRFYVVLLFVSSIMSTGSSSSMLIETERSFFRLERALGACRLILVWWATSKLSSSSHDCHLACFPEALADVSSHSKASWSVNMMKRLGPRLVRSSRTAHTTSRHFLWVLASFCAALINVHNRYPVCREVTSYFYCSNTHLTCE